MMYGTFEPMLEFIPIIKVVCSHLVAVTLFNLMIATFRPLPYLLWPFSENRDGEI